MPVELGCTKAGLYEPCPGRVMDFIPPVKVIPFLSDEHWS